MLCHWCAVFITFGKISIPLQTKSILVSRKMKNQADFVIIPECKLIIECCKGIVTLEDSLNLKIEELSDPQYNPTYNVIVDLQEVEIPLDSNPNEQITFFANYIKPLSLNCKVAFLTNEPHQVVIGEMLKQMTYEEPDVHIEIFSTLKAAINFLGLSNDKFDSISERLIELRTTKRVKKN